MVRKIAPSPRRRSPNSSAGGGGIRPPSRSGGSFTSRLLGNMLRTSQQQHELPSRSGSYTSLASVSRA